MMLASWNTPTLQTLQRCLPGCNRTQSPPLPGFREAYFTWQDVAVVQATRQATVIMIIMVGTKGKLMSDHKQHVFQQGETLKSNSFNTFLACTCEWHATGLYKYAGKFLVCYWGAVFDCMSLMHHSFHLIFFPQQLWQRSA